VTAEHRARRPQAVLFACGWNEVRSPIAAALLRHLAPTTMAGSA